MNSLILKTCARALFPFLILTGILFFLRGHEFAGGGFIAGLICGCAVAVRYFAFGKKYWAFPPPLWLALGLSLAIGSGIISLSNGKSFMTGLWISGMGTPVLFDLGVFCVVLGIIQTFLLCLGEEA